MEILDIPAKFPIPFANAAGVSYIRDIPEESQIPITPGAASLEDGFPPTTFAPVGAGGIPPSGQDFNGLFKQITEWLRWTQAGGPIAYDDTFAAAIGGYPRGATVAGATFGTAWVSLADNNTTVPGNPAATWLAFNISITASAVTGATHAYVAADSGSILHRSNAGAAMIDTLPGTAIGVLRPGTIIRVLNTDSAGLLAITSAAGAVIVGAAAGFLFLGPGQVATIYSDGANYSVLSVPEKCRLVANTNFNISATGSDAAAGITTGAAWATKQHAWDTLAKYFDLCGFRATINIADGTYTDGLLANQAVSSDIADDSSAAVRFVGNVALPQNVIINSNAVPFFIGVGNAVHIEGMTLQTPVANYAILSQGICTYNNVRFGAVNAAVGGGHIRADTNGLVVPLGDYSIVGSAVAHFVATNGGTIRTNIATSVVVTLTGTPAFSAAFATAVTGIIFAETGLMSFSGAATGLRYSATLNGVINTNGAGAGYFPGDTAGSTAAGGQYA